MWSVPNVFIVNMSLSDFMMTTLNCISNYIFMRDRQWYYGDTACLFNNFLAILTISASVLNLTAMSVTRYIISQRSCIFSFWLDCKVLSSAALFFLSRYYAIVFPFRRKVSKKVVTLIIAIAWIASVGIAMPTVFFSKA